MGESDPRCGDFRIAYPNASQPFDTMAFDAEVGDGCDKDFFDVTQIAMRVTSMEIDSQDWVADDLAGSVVGHIAASIGFKYFKAASGELVTRKENVRLLSASSECDDRGIVFDQDEKREFLARGFHAFDQAQLKVEGEGVRRTTEIEHSQWRVTVWMWERGFTRTFCFAHERSLKKVQGKKMREERKEDRERIEPLIDTNPHE